ncbi:MAG: signal peptidase II [Clostridiales bacterium]|nr:signal peptidase II [Clostridiales bacterium]
MAKTTKKTQNDKGMSALKGHWLWGALALCILLLIDLLTKVGAKVYFDTLGEANIVLIPNVLELTYIENPGMAFSMGADAPTPAKLAVVIGTALIMLLATVYYLKVDKRRSWLRWCLVFVIAGGVGNLIDRVLFKVWLEDGGGVRDMVLMDFSVWIEEWFNVPPTNFMDFGVCNFADFFIVGGAIALLLAFLFFDADAFFPVGKYKALAKEAEEAAEAKRKAKAEAKKAE